MFGNCAIGIARSDTSPAIAVTSAMTTASRGRSTKMDENIASAADRLFSRYSQHGQSRPQTLQASRGDQFATIEPFGDDDGSAHRLSNFYAPDGSLSILDDEDVDALLISDQRGLWHDDTFFRFVSFDTHLNKLTIDQPAIGIWQRSSHRDGVGRLINLDVNEINLARVLIDRSIRELHNDLRIVDCRLAVPAWREDPDELPLAHRKGDIHRIRTDNRRKYTGVRADDVAARHGSPPDPPVDSRVDIGIGEIDFFSFQCLLSCGQIPLCCLLRGQPLVTNSDRRCTCFHQLFGALELKRGIFEQRLRTQLCRLCLLNRRLKRTSLDAVQTRSGLDKLAILETHIVQIAGP